MLSLSNIQTEEFFYDSLITLIGGKTGINLGMYRKAFIEKRIRARMRHVNCDSYNSYYTYLLTNLDYESEKFKEQFNINYTYFFRNKEVFKKFEDIFMECLNCKSKIIENEIEEALIDPLKNKEFLNDKLILRKFHNLLIKNHEAATLFLKLIFKTKNFLNTFPISQSSLYYKIRFSKESIYIWSCPCASGEEPYSIAMILDDLRNQFIKFPNYKITASDIDLNALQKAKKGIYINSMEDIPQLYKVKYFTKQKEASRYKYILNEKIKEQIEFICEDVTKGHKYPLKYDIIFCRYLLIYFNRENRKFFLKIIEDHLEEGGLLFLGKTETLFQSNSNLKLIDPKYHIYMKINATKNLKENLSFVKKGL